MNIQYLNGIDIQYLNGAGAEYSHTLDARQQAVVARLNRQAHRQANRRRNTIANMTDGLTNNIAKKAEWVAVGNDFAGFAGDGSVADDERVRNYLKHTLEVAQAAPVMVSGYQNPAALIGQIGYVLNMWDTDKREEAIDNVIAEEERGIAMGSIDVNVAEDANEATAEDYYDIDNYTHNKGQKKRSFFKAVKKTLKPTLTTEAQDIVAANPATRKRRNSNRKRVADVRVANPVATANAAISGLMGEDDVEILAAGTDLEYAINGEDALACIKRYMERTRNVALNNPEEFESAEEAQYTAASIDQILRVWDNVALRSKIFTRLEQTQGLEGKLLKKVAKAVKKVTVAPVKATVKAVQTTAKAVAKATKKVGKAIAKVAKKAWKIVVRFNPLTLLIRAGILGFVRLNMFKIANKCYIGSLTKSVAKLKGATAEEWEKSNKAYGHLENAYTKLGGKASKLKSTLAKGNKKKWEGTEYPDDGNAIKAAANQISEADNKEAQADMDYDETLKEYNAKGYISDSTVSADTATVEKKEEYTIIENERTAKDAIKMYEGDDKETVLVTIPKAAKVLVDVTQTSNNLIAATYNGKNGWVEQSGLAGLGDCDAESVAILGIAGMCDETEGLGEPATATAIASASATIASIMAKIKNIFGVAKNVIDKGKDVISTTKNVVETGKEIKDAVKSGDVSTAAAKTVATVSNPSLLKASSNTTTTTAASKLPTLLKNSKAVKFVQEVAKEGSEVSNKAKEVVQNLTNNASSAQPVVEPVHTTTTNITTVAAEPKGNNKLILIGGGVLALGIVGYLLTRKK